MTNEGIGSGSLISRDGQILTNWHVVSGTREVGVIFRPIDDGVQVSSKDVKLAKVLKVDEVADLALLKVNDVPRYVSPLVLGAMSDVHVGSDVHAIGHPTGEAWTYTKGLVSQIRRSYAWKTEENKAHRADVIQTQTPINPGNSGGPLISDAGSIVGVNSFKAQGEALNFAVAVTEVNRFLSQSGNRYAATSAATTSQNRAQETCNAREIKRGRNRTNNADVIWYDLNCDGEWDAFLTVPDSQSEPITLSIDSKDVGKIDIVVVDLDRDGRWDISYHDLDGDGKPDLIGYHPDGQLKPSRFERYVAQH